MKRRHLALAAPLVLTLPLLAACSESSDKTAGDDPRSISVVSSADECGLSATEAPAGTLNFEVTNKGREITEFYLLAEDGLRIVGEVENIGENISRRLTLAVPAGKYVTACKPGMKGDGIRADFTVTPSEENVTVSDNEQELMDEATANYLTYVQDQSDQLLTKTARFVELYKSGKDDEARDLYAVARVHWERIEPVAESFGELDPLIDLREADVEEGDDWTGWHRIEKDLWPARAEGYQPMDDAARTKYADDLLANTKKLEVAVNADDFGFTVDGIANGATGLLEEVASGKVTGEEEYWSRTDLWDFQANVDGAKVAFDGVKDLLETKKPELADTLTKRFAALQELLDQHRVGDGFKYYDELTRAEVKSLADAVNALAEPLAGLSAVLLDRG